MIYNAKLAEDKKRDGGAKKVSKKPKIAAGKGVDAMARNNNPAMVADLMGGSEDDDYGEYDEEVVGSKREAESEYDFM